MKALFLALWRAAIYLLQIAFKLIDLFTTPDVSGSGPLITVLPYTMFLGLGLVLILFVAQLGIAAWRRDGQQLGLAVVGLGQFLLVWAGFLGLGAVLVASMSGLTHGLLEGTLGIGGFSDYSLTKGLFRDTTDAGVAVLLGVLGLILLVPAALAYIVIMLVREAGLLVLVATTPLSAAGLVADFSKTWFWKSLRAFFACLLVAPGSALVLGIGEQISKGVVQGAGNDTPQAIGHATVGVVLVAIGALCPLVLFKLLAFIEPSTRAGGAARNGLAAAGGVRALLGGRGGSSSSGSGAAEQADSSGVSGGEQSAEGTTESRLSSQLGPAGEAAGQISAQAEQAGQAMSDVANSAGAGQDSGDVPPPTGQGTNDTQPDSAAGPSPGSASPAGAAPAGDNGLPAPDLAGGGAGGLPQPPEPGNPAPGPAAQPPGGGGEIPPEAAVLA
ncbi:MAG: hypothetical protein ABI140_11775 [Jatrophihabitantaceae bacterium]